MGDAILSSLPLQILLFFNEAYRFLFFVLMLSGFIYKNNHFMYSDGVFGTEVFFLFAYFILDFGRGFQASKGNKTEQVGPLAISGILSVGVVMLHIYFFELQAYVLKLDRILNGIGVVFIALETLLMIFTSLTFYRDSNF